MLVRELIEKLKTLPQDVVVFIEDSMGDLVSNILAEEIKIKEHSTGEGKDSFNWYSKETTGEKLGILLK